MSRFALCDTVMIASARRAARSTQRTVEQHAPRRVVARVERQAHVVNRHDRRHRRRERHHAVGEVHDVGAELAQQPRRQRLHPHHPRHAPATTVATRTRGGSGRVVSIGRFDTTISSSSAPPARDDAADARCSSRRRCGPAAASCRQTRCASVSSQRIAGARQVQATIAMRDVGRREARGNESTSPCTRNGDARRSDAAPSAATSAIRRPAHAAHDAAAPRARTARRTRGRRADPPPTSTSRYMLLLWMRGSAFGSPA